jgi:hypothetical protein
MTQSRTYRPTSGPGGRATFRPGNRYRSLLLVLGVLAVIVGIASFTGPGDAAISAAHRFLEFFSGVFSLVALSICVMIGLASTDRVILMIHHRVLMQNVHRAFAMTAMLFLAVHIATKEMESHARLLDIVVPFMAHHRPMYVGFGTIASYLMILATWTGIARGRFAGNAPGLWRALHATAYVCWLFALAHGLLAGRSAKTWVLVSYGACLVGVGLALMVRLAVRLGRRTRILKAQTTGTIRPVGMAIDERPMARSVALTDTNGRGLAIPRPIPRPMDADERPRRQREPDAMTLGAEYIEDIPVIVGRPDDEPVWEERRRATGSGYAQIEPMAIGDAWDELADRGPLLKPGRAREDISDEEFWAHMRGEALR